MYAIIDIETTGGSYKYGKITEIAIFIHNGEKVVDKFESLVNPEIPIPDYVAKLTGINDKMVANAPKFYEIAREIVHLLDNRTFVAHNAHFDYSFVKQEFKSLGYEFRKKRLCTVQLARKIMPGYPSYSLGDICKSLHLPISERHRAAGDAAATVLLFEKLLHHDREGIINEHLRNVAHTSPLARHLSSQHIDILPEETGIFYFHNTEGTVIYLEKANDIHARVVHLLSETPHESRKGAAFSHIGDISFEVCGSELIAELREQEELEKLQPAFNKINERSKQYGVFIHDYNGYVQLVVQKIKAHDIYVPLTVFENQRQAENWLKRRVDNDGCCAVLCGFQSPCPYHRHEDCSTSISLAQDVNYYNQKIKNVLRKYQYPHQNFFIRGEGRKNSEFSLICIQNNVLKGYGYFSKDDSVGNNDILEQLQPYRGDTLTAEKIVRQFLKKHSTAKLYRF